MSEVFTEILGMAERAVAGSEADKSALAQVLDSTDLETIGRPGERAYFAALLDWQGYGQSSSCCS